MNRRKTIAMSWRTTPEIKKELRSLAKSANRSMSGMLEWLILEKKQNASESNSQDDKPSKRQKK